MAEDSPFKNAYDPMGPSSPNVIKCPKCGAQDFDAQSNQWGVHRTCRVCKNQWSGGGAGVYPDGSPPPPESPSEDDELPLPGEYVPTYRRFGGDDE